MKAQQIAQTYIDKKMVPIPLNKSGDGKGVLIPNWQTIYFEAKDFNESNNFGTNIALNNWIDIDLDSKNAVFFGAKFLKNTLTLGIVDPEIASLVHTTHYFYKAKGGEEFKIRKYPNGKTIAEVRVEGNTVVEPSIAKSKLFDNKFVQRKFNNSPEVICEDENLYKNFNKICVASVLQTVIASDNMPFVKLTSCLKRYCTDWTDSEIYNFCEAVASSIKGKGGRSIFSWKKIKAKVKSSLNNWEKENTKASGYQSFAKEVGLDEKYCRDMFEWIGKVPIEGSKEDRKTIIDFTEMAMSENAFLKEVERSYLVSPLICDVGLYIVAGKPKQGKSRLMKDLAYKVVNGGTWLGHTVAQGDVLLLSLEDNEDSMNIDIKSMGLQNKKKPTTFVDQCPSLERGLVESIELWHRKMDNPKLIIIDTFQKVKPMGSQKTKNANAYEVDYHYLSQLHATAKNLKICIIYVHHLSQADKSHSWDKIMGSTGHQGVTDAMYMLDRVEGTHKGTFKGLGRNIPGFEMDIEWNSNPEEPMTFQYVGDTFEIKTKEHKREIFKAMKQLALDGESEIKPNDVYKVLNLVSNKEKGACNKNMQRMRKNGELREGEKYGTYKLAYAANCYDDDGNINPDDNAPWVKAQGIDFEADKIESKH